MKTKTAVLAGLAMCALQGCAHGKAEEALDQKIAQQPSIASRADLKEEATTLIAAIPGLTASQRTSLAAIRDEVDARVGALQTHSYRLRAVLVRDLLATTYDDPEVELIKSQLKDIENQRLSAIFGAVERANQVLGHVTPESGSYLNSLFEPHFGKTEGGGGFHEGR